jgi:hypothetical protein
MTTPADNLREHLLSERLEADRLAAVASWEGLDPAVANVLRYLTGRLDAQKARLETLEARLGSLERAFNENPVVRRQP